MDSKQLASLGDLRRQPAPKVNAHDLSDIIQRKIISNKVSLEFLKTQREFSLASKKMQDYSISNTNEKIPLVEKLINLYEQQLNVFDPFKQEECLELYQQLNDLNVMPPDIIDIAKSLEALDDKMRDLAIKIDQIEATIPATKSGTQYSATIKQPDNPMGTCAYEHINPDLDYVE